jgi:hypothetical protein
MVSFFISKKQRFVAYSPMIRCLIFILWRSVQKTTITLGMEKLRLWYASSPDAAAWMLKFVFVYLANTSVLCYSLAIICCCQVKDCIYWIISTENDHRHHHKFIKYQKRLRKEGKNMFGLPIKQNICKFNASLDA